MDNSGQMLGGGFCDECQDFTAGINCHECVDGYFRPEGVLPNATEPCIGMFITYKNLALYNHSYSEHTNLVELQCEYWTQCKRFKQRDWCTSIL